MVHVLSLNPEVQADIAALIGTSAALSISGIPFNGPIGAARVGYVDGRICVESVGQTELAEQSKLNLVVAGTDVAVLMVESEAQELSRRDYAGRGGIRSRSNASWRSTQSTIWCDEAGKDAWDWTRAGKRSNPWWRKYYRIGGSRFAVKLMQIRQQAGADAIRVDAAFAVDVMASAEVTAES